ncbi:hypothetical protein BH10BDE1_BH10BDE1_33810 [soil metagenome]
MSHVSSDDSSEGRTHSSPEVEHVNPSVIAASFAEANTESLEAYEAEGFEDGETLEDLLGADDDSDDVDFSGDFSDDEAEEEAPVVSKTKAKAAVKAAKRAARGEALASDEEATGDETSDEEAPAKVQAEKKVVAAKVVAPKATVAAKAAAPKTEIIAKKPVKKTAKTIVESDFDEDGDEDLDDGGDEEVLRPAAEPVNGFEQFNLSEPVMKSLKKIGYSSPTPVQMLCLPLLLEEREGNGRDLVALARTGTGKTAAFGIPIVERIETSIRKPQALVLCPTRELCQQVAAALGQIGDGKRIRVLSIYGGDSYRRQFEGIQSGPHIIVATPGRLIDMLTRKALDLTSIRTLVLDEADEMISVGFREALDQILQSFSNRDEAAEPHCTWLFSATMSADIKRVQSRYIKNAKMIDARGSEEKPLIRQQYMLTFEEDRLEALKRYLHVNENFYGLIFCQTKAEVAETEASLKHEGFKVDSLHGDKVQRDREAVFAAWKKKTIKIVIATDVAARGLDVKGLTHVVNMSIPREDESYVHRIGRTGRAGQEGIALSFVWPKRMGILRQLERKLGVTLEHIAVPEPGDIARAVLGREVEALFNTPLEFKADNTSHQTIADLIQEKQPVSEEVLPMLAALAARILEKKNPALLSRPTIKALRADQGERSPYSSGGGGGYSRGGRYEGAREGGGGGYNRGGGGYDRGGGGGYNRDHRDDRGGGDRPQWNRGGDDRRSAGGGGGFSRPEGRPAGRIEPRGDSAPRDFAPRGGGIEPRGESRDFAPRGDSAPRGGGFESRPASRPEGRGPAAGDSGFRRTRPEGAKIERSYTRPQREGDDSRTTSDVAPRLRDRVAKSETGGGAPIKRRGPWEKR